jgi:hypothetical protein
MSNCLYLVQSDYAATPHALAQLAQLYQIGDQVLIMGEAVLHPESFANDYSIALLTSDAQMLNAIPKHVKVLSYADFADIVLSYTRCIRLK